jgi:hypothetical protein
LHAHLGARSPAPHASLLRAKGYIQREAGFRATASANNQQNAAADEKGKVSPHALIFKGGEMILYLFFI